MFERFANRFNTTGSCARADESAAACSSRQQSADCTNTALLLTKDTVDAVSIFVAAVRVITVSICCAMCRKMPLRFWTFCQNE